MRCITIFIFVIFFQDASSQNTINSLKVFVDCSSGGECYPEYVRQEIPIVDFVRDRLDADVHVIVNIQYNSIGTSQYAMRFMGRNNFSQYNDTLHFTVPPSSIDDAIRTAIVTHLKIGLIPFIAKTNQIDKVSISFAKSDSNVTSSSIEKDPWKYWVFQLSGNGYLNGSQNYFSGSAYFNISADKETAKTKTNIYLNNSEQVQKYNDGTNEYRYHFQDYGAGIEHVVKLTEHYGMGANFNASNSLFSNLRYKVSAAAMAEYSIFPYNEYNTKRWVAMYSIGPMYNNYYDTTIYLKTREFQFQQTLGSIFSYIQPWGSTHLGVFWNNYFSDFKKNNLSLNAALQFRITKGLNFAVWGNYSFVRNQINIRKGDIDLNQLLIRNQELLSSFDYNLGVGISYRFGSKFNSTVNPAFRGLNYSINL